jgi:hypothetical protein
MAEESPFGLTNENQDFSNLQEQNTGNDRQLGSNDPNRSTLSDDDRNTINRTNTRNGNSDNINSEGTKANAIATDKKTSLLGDSQYFNYRGVNGKNAADPNFESDQHILTIDSIIDHFNKYPSFGMKFTHFAYLKKLGVYPNNRLIIARRYPAPVPDNMFDTGGMAPIATVVSWMDPKESLLEISFNEKWEDATESLMDIFKEILSNDFGVKLDPPMPLPGFTVGLQYAIMNALGITNSGPDNVPQGNPNLVHETMRRRVPGDDLGGSGLESDFKIKMVCEYEQKYIGKVDPIVGYLDVIGNLLMMGTSEEEYLLTGGASEQIQNLFDLAKEGKWRELAESIIQAIVEGIDKLINKVQEALAVSGGGGGGGNGGEGGVAEYDNTYGGGEEPVESNILGVFTTALGSIADDVLSGIFSKYKIKMQAAIAAMSGMPNGPWHIMMGNPKNPFFVSGDMVCTKVTIDFKSELAYNDLPQEYTATLEFKPARNHGRAGIGSMLNQGKGRIYGTPPKDTYAANGNIGSSTRNTNANVSGQTQVAPDPGTGGDRTPI